MVADQFLIEWTHHFSSAVCAVDDNLTDQSQCLKSVKIDTLTFLQLQLMSTVSAASSINRVKLALV